MYYLGIDLGSSSVKLAVINADTGKTICSIIKPESEMLIESPKIGWAEQNPETWWHYVIKGILSINTQFNFDTKLIKAIGVSYQMHGLVVTDENLNPLRNSIIWCDSRAVEIGRDATKKLGKIYCKNMLLGEPGNFTASKLKWLKEFEREIYNKSKFAMLPGDFIAAKLTGVAQTTPSGLSEAALWNFSTQKLSSSVIEVMGLDKSKIPEIVPNIGFQAKINADVAKTLHLNPEIKITYRAGDQSNNAYSLNVNNPGEIAATAGTSAVIYAISNKNINDDKQRINTFLHVNNSKSHKRNGVMLCINGSGILYRWLRNTLSVGLKTKLTYPELNNIAKLSNAGSDGLKFYPFGNGTERIFQNKQIFSGIKNLNYNIHKSEHLVRSACEGIIFAMNYGFEIMKSLMPIENTVKASRANLFLSPIFRDIFCNITQTNLELYNTSGAEGAARGAALGDGFYTNKDEAFNNLKLLTSVEPNSQLSATYKELYEEWKSGLEF